MLQSISSSPFSLSLQDYLLVGEILSLQQCSSQIRALSQSWNLANYYFDNQLFHHNIDKVTKQKDLSKIKCIQFFGVSELPRIMILPMQQLVFNTHLTSLAIDGCHKLTDSDVITMINNQPSLKRLSLYWMPQLTDIVLHTISTSPCIAQLETLCVSGMTKATANAMASCFTKMPLCTSLDITRIPSLNELVLNSISETMPSLRKLLIYANNTTPPLGVIDIAKNCIFLRQLDLTGCTLITDEVIESLSRHCNLMDDICLQWCIRLTDSSLESMSAGMKVLSRLSIHGCVKMTIEGLRRAAPVSYKITVFHQISFILTNYSFFCS